MMRVPLLLVATATAARGADPCTSQTACDTCLPEQGCGWCSTKIVYEDGSTGSNCAGPQYEKPFSCNGIYSTQSCLPGWVCDPVNGCGQGPPGTGVAKDTCETSCKAPPAPPAPAEPVYKCDTATKACAVVPAGTGGAASKPVCEAACSQPPTPPPAPSPPAPAPTPAPVFTCDAATSTCSPAAIGTPGAASKEVCEQQCVSSTAYVCNRKTFQCAEASGAGFPSLDACQKGCAPETDPCEPHYTCSECLSASPQCGWCSQNVTYQDGKVGTQCAGVGPGINTFACMGQYSTDKCDVPNKCSVLTDIMFTLDGSCSIKPDEWTKSKSAVKDIASAFTFGTGGQNGSFARMGIVQFGGGTTVEQPLTGDESVFMSTLNGMPQRTEKCHTHTHDGLVATKKQFNNVRPNTNYRAAIVITDGIPTTDEDKHENKDAIKVSQNMQNEGIDVFAVYICNSGKKGNCGKGKKFMDQMASKPTSTYSLSVAKWDDVKQLIQSILDAICRH